MQEKILVYEAAIRGSIFVAIFAAMALWETKSPARRPALGRLWHYANNLGIVAVGMAANRIIFSTTLVGYAVFVEHRGWGVFPWLGLPTWLSALTSIVLLDCVIYWQHVVFHRIPILWRLHRMHHADTDYDVTTGNRFHPIELILSLAVKFVVVTLLGTPAIAVIAFETILNGMAMFNHGNVRLPANIDRLVRRLFVTPDMHRVHHSVHIEETNSNYGFNLSIWDRLFGTYIAQPKDGHDAMLIGLEDFRDPKFGRVDRLLLMPFM